MPFVISTGTIVTGFGAGIISVNLSLTPQIQRLYQLGSGIPFDRNVTRQNQLNITRYGGVNSSINVEASASCTDANSTAISIVGGGCAGNEVNVSDNWYVSSYSYQKDVQGWGQESWSFISKPLVIGSSATATMIRGTAEGQSTNDGGADTGVVFLDTLIQGNTIEVSAGSPGIGRAFEFDYGEVQIVGGTTTGKADGLDGNASVSIPYTPIYIP